MLSFQVVSFFFLRFSVPVVPDEDLEYLAWSVATGRVGDRECNRLCQFVKNFGNLFSQKAVHARLGLIIWCFFWKQDRLTWQI